MIVHVKTMWADSAGMMLAKKARKPLLNYGGQHERSRRGCHDQATAGEAADAEEVSGDTEGSAGDDEV